MDRGADSSIFDFKKSISTICSNYSARPILKTWILIQAKIKKNDKIFMRAVHPISLWSGLRVKMGRAYHTSQN
jgi:hypothetical protein